MTPCNWVDALRLFGTNCLIFQGRM